MKEIHIVPYCDSVEHRGGKVDAPLEREVLDEDGTLRQVDVCRACDEKYLAPAREIAEQGIVPERRRALPAPPRARASASRDAALPTGCNQCDYEGPTRSALGAHVKLQHGMSLREAGLALIGPDKITHDA